MSKNKIPKVDIYSKQYYVYHNVSRRYTNCSNILNEALSEREYTIEQLADSIKTDTFKIETTYYTQNILTFIYIEVFNLLTNFSIHKCSSCQKYFVPKSRITEIYCDNCRDKGYLNKIKNDELLKAYNTAYKTKHAQKQRKTKGKSPETNNKYEEALSKWRDSAKQKLGEYQDKYLLEKEESGKRLVIEEFKEFLNKDFQLES